LIENKSDMIRNIKSGICKYDHLKIRAYTT